MKNTLCVRLMMIGGCASALGLGSNAWAQNFESTIDTNASTTNINMAVVLDTAGTLIGDYDASTNPGGTQTRPGFFGGAGNQLINTSMSLGAPVPSTRISVS